MDKQPNAGINKSYVKTEQSANRVEQVEISELPKQSDRPFNIKKSAAKVRKKEDGVLGGT